MARATYTLNILTAGTYAPFIRLSNPPGSTGTFSSHFIISGVSGEEFTLKGGLSWTTVTAKFPLSLPAGPLVVVFKVDTTPLGGGFADVVGVQ